jgi:hypothetical protein
MTSNNSMHQYYKGLTERMVSEIKTVSEEIAHAGEKGRNNEAVIREFLSRHLPERYKVSTGKVVSANGQLSQQVDVIIHDRWHTPGLKLAKEWSIVPIESVRAVVAVKTTLDRGTLREGMDNIRSVRCLPRSAALLGTAGGTGANKILRPRGLIFGFQSGWATHDGLRAAFVDLLGDVDDSVRPNAVCALEQAFLVRRPYQTNLIDYIEYPLLHFFLFLVKTMDRFPDYRVDITRYFTEQYDESKEGEEGASSS